MNDTRPTTINGIHADKLKLDEQRLADRVRDLSTATVIRPALIDPDEVDLARKKFMTPAGTLEALEKMAALRLAWLNERDGLRSDLMLSLAQKESAMKFFTTHPDLPERPAPVQQPGQWETVRGITPPQAPAQPPAKSDSAYALAAILAAQTKLLARIADTLDQIAANTAPAAPNYKRPFVDFAKFDWATIGAVITARDDDGVSAVEYNGYDFTRRAGTGKYGKAIWFSRPTGKDAEGQNTYARLITFKDATEAEPLPKK